MAKHSKKKAPTKLSTIIVGLLTAISCIGGMSCALFLPWFWQGRFEGFRHLYATERTYYLGYWQDSSARDQTIKHFQDKTCQESQRMQSDAYSLKGLGIDVLKRSAGSIASSVGGCKEEDEPEGGSKNGTYNSFACMMEHIEELPNSIFGCTFWIECRQAAAQRCLMYRVVNIMLTTSFWCICVGSCFGILSLVFLFAEKFAGKKKKVLASARLKTFICNLCMMLSIYVAGLCAAYAWYMMLAGFRQTQIFPVPWIYIGPFVMTLSIGLSSCSCAFTVDRAFPYIWESICPCFAKQTPIVGDAGEFFGSEEEGADQAMGYGGMDIYGMGPPLGMGGQALL